MRLTSLPLQLLAFVVLPLLLLLTIVAFGGVALHQEEMREMLLNHNRAIVSGAAQNLSQQLAQRAAVLDAFVQALGGEPERALERTGWLVPLFDGGVAVSANGESWTAVPADAWRQDWAVALSRANASDIVPLVDPERSTTVVLIASGQAGRELRIAGVVTLERLLGGGILDSLHTSHSTDVYLLGQDGALLYGSAPGQLASDAIDLPESVAAPDGAAAAQVKDAAGRDTIRTTAPVGAAGWTLVHEERWQETLSPLMRYSQAAPLALVPAILIAVGAMWFGIQRVVYPLRRLEAQAAKLSWGGSELGTADVGGIAEIRRLQDTLRDMAARLRTAQASMHHYIGAITRAQEEERRRLARELHDQTAQALVALDHRQQMLKPHLKDDPAAAALLAEVRTMIAETIDDLRRIVRALRPIYLEELGLAPALQMLARDLGVDDTMAIHFEQKGTALRLPPDHEMALYRISQEALNNAWQHSQARHVWVTITFADEQVTLTVRDDGKGFHPPRHAVDLGESGRPHFGLMGMYERAALIGAELEVHAEPGGGTHVSVRAPVTRPIAPSAASAETQEAP